MPKTKVPNSKRNRDAGKEDKLKDFDMQLEQNVIAYEMKAKQDKDIINSMIENMIAALPRDILKMKLSDLRSFSQKTINEVKNTIESQKDLSTSLMLSSTKAASKTDDGYVTEGNTTGNSDFASEKTIHMVPPSQFGRTPRIGMMSAKAKSRRSRSAEPPQGSVLGSAMKSRTRTTATDHASRSKLRTPMPAARPRATSADNEKAIYEPKTPPRSPSSPATWLRWPKPGEKIISVTGTPLVSHSAPEKFANVNIPVGDGVLSLRPKRMDDIDRSIVQKICPKTMEQIKMLQSNLNRIMEYANQEG
ncbi:borr family protein [Megaselia abdita]